MYAQITRKIISSYDVVFDESFTSPLAYKSRPYSEGMDMRTEVTYTLYTTSSKEQTGDIITLSQFEEGDLVSETCNNAESGDKSDNNSIMPPLLSEKEMDEMDSRDGSDAELISTEMLEDICDRSKSYLNINRIEARYELLYNIKQRQPEWEGALKYTRNMGKVLHKVFKTVVKEVSQDLPPLGESGSEVSHLIPEPIKISEGTILSDDISKPWIKATKKEIQT